MGEVDEVEQTENDRQPDRDQKVDHPQPKAVEYLEQVKIKHAETLGQVAAGAALSCATGDGSADQPSTQLVASTGGKDWPALSTLARSSLSAMSALALPIIR